MALALFAGPGLLTRAPKVEIYRVNAVATLKGPPDGLSGGRNRNKVNVIGHQAVRANVQNTGAEQLNTAS